MRYFALNSGIIDTSSSTVNINIRDGKMHSIHAYHSSPLARPIQSPIHCDVYFGQRHSVIRPTNYHLLITIFLTYSPQHFHCFKHYFLHSQQVIPHYIVTTYRRLKTLSLSYTYASGHTSIKRIILREASHTRCKLVTTTS